MRVLHLLSDYRWTGIAEPVAQLVATLRRLGITADLACRRPPHDGPSGRMPFVVDKAETLGIEPLTGFHLNQTRRLSGTLIDVRRLIRYLRKHRVDVVHAHRPQDHLIAALASRRANGPILVRTNHTCTPLEPTMVHRLSFRMRTDGYVGFSQCAADRDAAAFGLRPQQVFVIHSSIDLKRFNTDTPRHDMRPELSLSPQHVVGGIVARVQPHRRFNLLFEAIALARRRVPTLRFIVIGSGTDYDQVVRAPLDRLGLADAIVLAGHRNDDYVDCLACLDFSVLLVPGSDGTCRAVREVMAMGKPVITSRRGLLPELVPHDSTGLNADETPDDLAEAIVALASDPDRRRRMGAAAANHAREKFCLDAQAKAVLDIYERLLASRSPS